MNRRRLITVMSFYLSFALPAAAGMTAETQLETAAGSGNSTSFTGERPQGSPDAVVAGSTTSASAPATATTPSAPVIDQDHPVPTPPTDGGKKGFMSSASDRVMGAFKNVPVNQTLAGAGFGAGIGILMFMGPLGLVGGAALGALIGATLFSGVIGKLFNPKHEGTGDS
jgi:hypothetical protein